MTLKSNLRKLEALRAQAASLAEKIEASRRQALVSIHKNHGFDTVAAFVTAVRTANEDAPAKTARRGRSRKSSAPAATPAKSSATKSVKKRRRAKITAEMKDQLKALVTDGKTGQEIAKTLKISMPSVHNIKKELGLTKSRK